jgi:outer membrane protein OmpA-like peptidoglycan-associated protein
LLIFLEKSVVKTEPIVSEVKELDKENASELIINEESPVENEIDEDLKISLDNFELVVFDQIFYKYNSSKISPTSTDQLDQLAYYMTNYPGIKVELTAHTDCRGHRAFNQKLSLSRALSAKDYLKSKGISAERIIAIGRGEDEVRNHCTDGVYCTEKEHEYNRRTEVRVIMNE